MVDTVINGTRTSRSILGNLSIPDDPAEAIALLKSSGWPIDFGPLNPAGLSQKGTDLNKASLLTDALCSALGLATTATPTEAMEKLRQLTATAQSTANSANTNANGRTRIEAGTKSVSSGKFSLDFSFTPQVVMVGLSDRNGNPCVAIRNCNRTNMQGDNASVSWGGTRVSFSFYSFVATPVTVYYAGIG